MAPNRTKTYVCIVSSYLDRWVWDWIAQGWAGWLRKWALAGLPLLLFFWKIWKIKYLNSLILWYRTDEILRSSDMKLNLLISRAKARVAIGGKGGVSLVLLGVLHLMRKDSFSPNQSHSDSFRSVQIHSFPPKFIQSHPDPPYLKQICSDSRRLLQTQTD